LTYHKLYFPNDLLQDIPSIRKQEKNIQKYKKYKFQSIYILYIALSSKLIKKAPTIIQSKKEKFIRASFRLIFEAFVQLDYHSNSITASILSLYVSMEIIASKTTSEKNM